LLRPCRFTSPKEQVCQTLSFWVAKLPLIVQSGSDVAWHSSQ
jgi:hypothetical protein